VFIQKTLARSSAREDQNSVTLQKPIELPVIITVEEQAIGNIQV
jgi:hypothetical protein